MKIEIGDFIIHKNDGAGGAYYRQVVEIRPHETIVCNVWDKALGLKKGLNKCPHPKSPNISTTPYGEFYWKVDIEMRVTRILIEVLDET